MSATKEELLGEGPVEAALPMVNDWPALMTPKIAGAYLGLSERQLRDMRAVDLECERKGERPIGPMFIYLSKVMVRYRRVDVDRWVETLQQQNPRIALMLEVYRDRKK